MKKLLAGILFLLVLLAAVLTVRTLRFESRQVSVEPISVSAVDAGSVAEKLAGALRFRTISHQDPSLFDGEQFQGLHTYLEEAFPAVHATLERETVSDYSLLFRWPGSDPSLNPVLLMAHSDVVPVEEGTESEWSYPAFGGEIAEGFVWGRGAMDDKGSLVTTLAAVEALVNEGFKPRRTIYLAYGHDEEVGGQNGAATIANLLGSRGVQLEYVLDEGGAITDMVPGVDGVVALVGVAEKGFLSLELTVRVQGGHSSMPPPETAVGILSAAIDKLQENPMPAALRGATAAMFDYLGPEMPFTRRLALANRWLFGGLIERQFGSSPEGNAMLRTTTAPTIFQAGVKDNVLPSSARAVVNFRIMPGDSQTSVFERVTDIIDDPRIKIEPLADLSEPSPMSDLQSESFQGLQRTIRQLFPDAVVSPWLTVGGTDSRYFVSLTPNVYRFSPVILGQGDLNRAHGKDERMSVEACGTLVTFYVQLLRNTVS